MLENLRELLDSDPQVAQEALETARLELLRARRSALLQLRGSGVISEDAFEIVVVELDEALSQIEAQESDPVE